MTRNIFLKRLLPLILTLVLVMSNVALAAPADSKSGEGNENAVWEKVETGTIEGLTPGHADKLGNLSTDDFIPSGNVRVSIIVDGLSTMGAGYDTQNISSNTAAKRYRGEVLANQKALEKKISAEALGGAKLDVVWNLTLAANIISANVPAIKISAIKAVDGVKDVIIENQYEPAATVETNDPNMSVASGMTGIQPVWASGYTGAGSKVAIIDTGIDTDHQSFDAEAFDYAIEETGKEVDLLEEADIEAVYEQLNIKSVASASDFYLTSKIPFAANYVDLDLDVTHDNDKQGEHGSHVAGIAAANRFVKIDGEFTNALESVRTQGEAPDAQIYVMKVFGKGGGAYDADYMAAIEDAIILGADSVNLSLGSSVAGLPFDDYYNDVLEEMAASSTVVTMSAGNNGSWADETYALGYLYSDDVNLHTGGSPGSFANSFTVASVDNDGFTGSYLKLGEDMIFYTETVGEYKNSAMVGISGEHDYVYVDGPAIITDDDDNYLADQFTAVADKLEGVIAICNRGSSSFFMKANSAIEKGAIATVIANNQAGTINMNLTGYEYDAPAVSITQADAALLKSGAESSEEVTYELITGTDESGAPVTEEATVTVYYGKITVSSDTATIHYDADNYTMSSFSSWGVPGDLSLKPEITAPGGNIYSVNGAIAGGQAYENMSGTSMAAPQVAGLAAVFKQYLRENDIAAKTGLSERQLTNSLFMSTAKPLIEADAESYYSVMKQGAGLVDIEAAMNSRTLIQMDESSTKSAADGKIKVELGDDPERTGAYSAAFSVSNISEEPLLVSLGADFFTQDVFGYYTYGADGKALVDESGNPVVSTYLDQWTYPLSADTVWTVNGKELSGVYDFNGDGIGNEADAQTLLDFVTGVIDEISNEDMADIDGDGDIDTYDAYRALDINADGSYAYIPAGESIDVSVDFELPEAMNYDDNGTYVEGYLWVTEADMADGVLGTEHSIPVVGYYGDWSEPSMTDKGSALEYAYGEEARLPYLTAALGTDAMDIESFLIKYAGDKNEYLFGGNPYQYDEEYMPERNAMSSDDTITAYRYTLIRNSAGSRFTVDNGTETVYEAEEAGKYAAYYYQNQGAWYNTNTSFKTAYTPAGVAEGTELNMNVTMAPVYYRDAEGNIAWDALSENATVSMPFVIDDTDPVISNVEFVEDAETGKYTAINVTASDNEYIASIGLFTEADEAVEVLGSLADTEKGAENVYTFDISAFEEEHYYVSIGDYARNEVLYKINLNAEELAGGVEAVEVSPAEATVIKGTTLKLTVTVTPWGINDKVTWTSSDETIATVDANGIVTGVAVGTATVTATSVEDETKSGTVEIEVIEFDKELNGVVWDENGAIWVSEFNLKSIPDYTKLSGEIKNDIASVAVDPYAGMMYAASFDSNEGTSSLYTMDPDNGFAVTEIGPSRVGYTDLAIAPGLSINYGKEILVATYGKYAVFIDAATGDYFGAYEFSGDLVGIAYEGTGQYSEGIYYDWYFFIDTEGNVHETGFVYMDDTLYWFGDNVDGNLGYTTGTDYYNSVYISYEEDGTENLYWSRFDMSENKVDILVTEIIYDEEGNVSLGETYNTGSFADSVWPVGGLFEMPEEEGGDEGSRVVDKAARIGNLSAAAVTSVEKVAFADKAAKGGLNAFTVSEGTDNIKGHGGIVAEPQGSGIAGINIAITPDVSEEGEVIHNGLYEVTWDPEAMELVSNGSALLMTSTNKNEEEGSLVFGWVDAEGCTADDAVLQLTFKRLKEDVETTVEITTLDNGAANPNTAEKYVFSATGGIEVGSGVTGIEMAKDASVTVGETITLEPEVLPADALNKAVTFTSSDEKIAKVDENGVVTGVKAGKATITATTEDGGFTAETVVRVLFKDVPGTHSYANAVYWAVDEGIASGYTGAKAGLFGIGDDITRGQVVMFLWRAADMPEPEKNTQTFKDVPTSHNFYKAIQWAVEQGITGGYTGARKGYFGPSDNCTRGQIVTFLWRYAGQQAPEKDTQTFTDVPVKHNFYKAIQWAVEQGITAGYKDGSFGVNKTCTRGQCVTFLYRLLGKKQ